MSTARTRRPLDAIASSLVALVFGHLNAADHAALARTNRTNRAVSRLPAASPRAYVHLAIHGTDVRTLPTWIRPADFTFVLSSMTVAETDCFCALRRSMSASLTSIAVHDWRRDEFGVPVHKEYPATPLLDFDACVNLRALDLHALHLPAALSLDALLAKLATSRPGLTSLSTPTLAKAESFDRLPATLTLLRVFFARRAPFDAFDFRPLSRLVALARLELPGRWHSVAETHQIASALPASLRALKLGRLACGEMWDWSEGVNLVLPEALVDFGFAFEPASARLRLPAGLRRLDMLLVVDMDADEKEEAALLKCVPVAPDGLEFYRLGLLPKQHLAEPNFPGPPRRQLNCRRLLRPCAALRSLHLVDASLFCAHDTLCAVERISLGERPGVRLGASLGKTKGTGAVCDGLADAFPSLTALTLGGLLVSPMHGARPRLPFAKMLGLPTGVAGRPSWNLSVLDLGAMSGLQAYTADEPITTYVGFMASADRPTDCLVDAIVDGCPLLASLSLPFLTLCRGGDPLAKKSHIHEACWLVYMAHALRRFAHLRHLDVRRLGPLPDAALKRLAGLANLSRLAIKDTGSAVFGADIRDALRWRGADLELAALSGEDETRANRAWQEPAIEALAAPATTTSSAWAEAWAAD